VEADAVSGKALLLAGAAALLPVVAGQVSAQSTAASSQPFAPPESPQVLTRTVWRTLSDGNQIVVRRRYEVQFSRHADGFRLDGRLLDAAVEAPLLLAALAEIERKRSDEGMFPVLIDAAGRIRESVSARRGSPAQRDDARVQAQRLLAGTPQPLAEQQASGTFLAQVADHGALTAWPVDLFNPATGERHERRRIALPDGQEGEVAVSVKVTEPQQFGLPRSVERTVTTVMAGTSRTSREQWTLVPVDGSLR
jgi:hypothetical protein